MSETISLVNEVKENVGKNQLAKIEIPAYIINNIKYQLFDWQKSALQYFLAYENPDNNLVAEEYAPHHLLFNMATGTGKTLLMAALILYYYEKGYRHFIFFVNQNNIVGKTEENLINPSHQKYLFKQKIVIGDKTIRVKKVGTFSDKTEDIQILFTSIHKLHNSIYVEKENSPTLKDLQKRNIIMLGDEAHHLNADTMRNNGQTELDLPTELSEKASETDLERSWENTVIKKILYRGVYPSSQKNDNVLLEFTATIPRDESVKEKYRTKTVFSFDLKEFLKAGYTKEINLVSSSFATEKKKKRILQALLFNWYRSKLARDFIQNFKPVILFRSKLIADSQRDFEEFKELIKTLSSKDFSFIDKYEEEKLLGKEIYEKGKSRIVDIKHFIADNKIEWNEIINYLQYTFKENHCIITNSKGGTKTIERTTAEQEKLLNSLEDKTNKISAIFTVKRLTEGWDVLNLYDIVRLYEGQNEGGSNTKTSEATTSEVQLIGRGVRYFPFAFENKPLLKRKFDDNLGHELRVLEEFYYHSDDDHRYLSQLKNELKVKGYIDDEKKVKIFALKKEFKDTDFYKKIKLWLNEQQDNPNSKKLTLKEIKKKFEFSFTIPLTNVQEEGIIMDKEEDKKRYATKKEDGKTISALLKEFNRHIIRKAINIKAKKDLSLFRFENLKDELKIESVDEILEDKFLGDLQLNIVTPKSFKDLNDVSNEIQLEILLRFFDKIEDYLKEISNPFIGSEFTATKFNAVFEDSKEKMIVENEESKTLEKELVDKKWYVLDSFNGTSEERNLIYFLKDTMGNLENKYELVYLLRNEEVYTIYDFDKGRGFQPDFLLFLKQKKKNLYYQVFIEPKGGQFKDETGGFETSKEGWKEKFLIDITKKYSNSDLLKFENEEYKLIGLPLFNEKKKEDFRKNYNSTLEVK